MRTIEVSAKTVDLAIEKGLQMLEATREQVKINVLEKETMLKKAKIEIVLYETEEEKTEALKNAKSEKNAIEQIKHAKADMSDCEERFELNETELLDSVNEIRKAHFGSHSNIS